MPLFDSYLYNKVQRNSPIGDINILNKMIWYLVKEYYVAKPDVESLVPVERKK